MVAVIKTGHSIHRILNYNENKVREGKAECISACNYPIDAKKLSFNYKLNMLLKQASLNENVSRNSVHISLNFDPSEKLSCDQLKEITETYMQKIGFGGQPCLVYQHFDSGHPHIHIVSIKVRADGSRIDTQNIGRNQSEKARKEIEIQYGVVKAEDQNKQQYELMGISLQKVKYGKSDSRRAIAKVLEGILNTYKYTSSPELNAVLNLYNVHADKGGENSRVAQHSGLLYHILDEHGNKIGVPIKASLFYNSPTLKYLEERFTINEASRQSLKARVKNAIDLTLLKQPNLSIDKLIKALEKEGIVAVLRKNTEGLMYGITYVDHRSKCIFNGSALGKQYSAKAIQERCEALTETAAPGHTFNDKHSPNTFSKNEQMEQPSASKNFEGIELLETLLQAELTSGYLPNQLTKKGKKKRKKQISKNI